MTDEIEVARVGGEVDSWCGRCRALETHLVVAVVDGKPKRLVCRECAAEHRPRRVPGEKKPRKPRAVSAPPKLEIVPPPPPPPDVAKMVGDRPVADYSLAWLPRAQDAVRHPVFGLGIALCPVLGTVLPKFRVLFEGGRERVIACGR